jgi:hypothetical protein
MPPPTQTTVTPWLSRIVSSSTSSAGEVAELVPGVGVQPAVGVRHPPGELPEQDRQRHRADRDDSQREQRARSGPGQHGRHREHSRPDDAADDQARCRGDAEGVGLLLVSRGHLLG